eukprot:4039646-Alexandrium_andersonii.AAC.1
MRCVVGGERSSTGTFCDTDCVLGVLIFAPRVRIACRLRRAVSGCVAAQPMASCTLTVASSCC